TINFQRQTYTDWTLVLAPKKSGVFTIPPIQLAGASSQALLITVRDQNANENLFVTVETDKKSAFVQEQIILTIRLYTAVALEDLGLEQPNISNAVMVPLDQKDFQTTHNGRPYLVRETRYALFPQTSGTLTIPSLNYNVLVSRGRQRLLD